MVMWGGGRISVVNTKSISPIQTTVYGRLSVTQHIVLFMIAVHIYGAFLYDNITVGKTFISFNIEKPARKFDVLHIAAASDEVE
jgi:hypothetical protein